jgi:hypothetical protein
MASPVPPAYLFATVSSRELAKVEAFPPKVLLFTVIYIYIYIYIYILEDDEHRLDLQL